MYQGGSFFLLYGKEEQIVKFSELKMKKKNMFICKFKQINKETVEEPSKKNKLLEKRNY